MTKSDPSKETNDEWLQKSIKEVADYKYALEESFIVAITDQKGIINYVNDNFCKISKYSREELIGQDHRIINSGFHTKEFIRNLWVTIANGKIWRGELKNKAKDGSYYWVDTTIVPFLNSEGKPYQYVATRADITARKYAEDEVIKAYDEREMVLNRISYSVISLDNEWRYTYLNDAALATHPLGKQETLGKVIWDVHPGAKGTVFWDKYHEARQTQKEVDIETYYAPMNNYFSVKVYPSPDGLTIFYKDITESKNAESELSQSLKEVKDYKFALDEASIVAITDQKGIINYVNNNFCKISKYSRRELIGQDHRIINSGFHPKEFIRNLWITIANGKIWRGELKNKAKDGTFYWVDTTIVPFLDERGKPYQYVAIRADITARKETEAHLEKSLKEVSDYRYALDESSIVAITDQKGIIGYVNDNFCKISKYSRRELIGQDHRIINSGFHPKEFIRNLWITIANGKIWRGELKNKAKDGTFYWVDTTIVPFLDECGKPYQYVAIRADITARKKAEEHLKKSLKEISDYKYALEESSIVAITDQKGIINYANDNFCKISKYSRKELIGQDHRMINSGFHPEEFIRTLWTTIANGKIWHGELKNKAKDGTFYWVDTTIVPFLDERGKPYQYIAIRADITARKLSEEENLKLNEKLEERVKQRTEEIEAFSYSISHDLRAPLRAVNGYAKILEEDYAAIYDDEGKRLLRVVQDNAKKMGMLIDDLLRFSRLGRKEINKSMVNMTLLAENALNELKIAMPIKAAVKIKTLHPVIADKTLMNQVWANLLSNAVKYSSNTKKPVIKINSVKKSDELIYSISDNGVGFDMQYAHKLFGVFQRLHSDEDFEGTGVGLALVHRIITRQGGKIWAKAEIDKGATFYFSLPEKATN